MGNRKASDKLPIPNWFRLQNYFGLRMMVEPAAWLDQLALRIDLLSLWKNISPFTHGRAGTMLVDKFYCDEFVCASQDILRKQSRKRCWRQWSHREPWKVATGPATHDPQQALCSVHVEIARLPVTLGEKQLGCSGGSTAYHETQKLRPHQQAEGVAGRVERKSSGLER